jgi:hypothetical protein
LISLISRDIAVNSLVDSAIICRMRNQILATIFSWALFPWLALAEDPSALKVSDLVCLKKALHNADQSQLEQRYQSYADQMTSYLSDLPSCLNIWLNVNKIKREHIETPAIIDMMLSKADKGMMEHIAAASVARQNLVKITSGEALKQIDTNHRWELPASLSEIRPPAEVTDAKDLSPRILRQIPK